MWNKVRDFVHEHRLLSDTEQYIVALSGGADSVALLLLLHDAGYRIHAAHCNFHLRGAESDADEAFCEQLCEQYDIPLHRAHFDTVTYARLHKVSIEMAARELRYRWFEQLRQDLPAAGICVAHHRDDLVETVLMNLIRGTGLRGLTGIQPRRGYVLRPLLCVARSEIEQYLKARGQHYVTDSTNLQADVLRNRIRLQVLPLLGELNPAVADNIQRTADNLAGAQAVLDALIPASATEGSLDLSGFRDIAAAEYVAFEWLKKYGFNGSQVRQILTAETGRTISSPTGYDVLKDRCRLMVEPVLTPMKPLVVPEEGCYVVPGDNPPAISSATAGQPPRRPAKMVVRFRHAYVSRNPLVATLDAGKVRFPLVVRRVERGDWLIPYGMKGRRLLSDLMTDSKMTFFEKRRQLVVTDASGRIVWAVGLRVDARFAVDAQTDRVLEVSAL